jgi:tetratricopeptide (TPR) repeat protein
MRFVNVQLQLEKHWRAVNRAALSRIGFIVLSGMLAKTLMAQTSGTKSDDALIVAKQGIDLAARGRCKEALPKLNHSIGQVGDKSLGYRAEMATARCAMSIEDTEMAAGALFRLRREFPGDPEVLYTTTHFFSELAMRSSQELAAMAPASSQAQQLEAEAFESQGKWDQATLQYQKILEGNPRTPGIHYRLGRIFLSKSPADEVNANKEFEEELKIDPESAPAEFMLGESARQAGRWDEAVTRFSKVTKLDEGFLEAYLALGMSLNAAGKFSDTIAPLQKYVKLQPGDPAGHYQLGMAYVRLGRKQDADHEMQMQQEAAAKAQGARNSER